MIGVCVFIFFLPWFNVLASNLIVNTTLGLVEGTHFETASGKVVSAFLGIPYANIPVGDLRFHDPILTFHWDGIFPAKQFNEKCIQFADDNSDFPRVIGSENCLYLNVFTPIASEFLNLEVVFFIHGGGFMRGSADMYTPDYIMDRANIVFVTANYRLGPLGFLSTEDKVIPGNFGLKDQVMALKWIRKNIQNFGGDKNKITLMGEDAGAASVHLHFLSPLSRIMFKQGISMGGSAFCPWALAKQPRWKAVQLARSLGCVNTTTSHDILDCLSTKHIDTKEIMMKTKELFMPWNFLPFSPFGPVIEKKASTAFLYNHPYKIIKDRLSKDAPWLVGFSSHAGLYPGAKFARNHAILEEIDENWDNIAPLLLDYNFTVPRDMLHSVNEKVRHFYFEDKEISVKLRKEFISMLTDRLFVNGIESAVRLQASVSVNYTFLYRFGNRGRYSKSYLLCNCTENMGASHGDDLLFLFKHEGLDVTETRYGRELQEKMIDVIIAFLNMGVPKYASDTVWSPVQREAFAGYNVDYMDILTGRSLNLEKKPDLANIKFWSSLHLAELKNVIGEHKKFFDEL